MQPIIYNSSDTNAPQLTIAAGTLRTVLKACLITGYGSKPAAGWEIAWADDVANKIAFRSKNTTSIKSVLLVNDNAAASATVTAYKDWDSATNTGTGQFATGYFVKQWNTGFTPNWVVIATDKFFYLFVQCDSVPQTMRVISGFGDAISLRNDKSYSVCLCQPSATYLQSNTGYITIPTQTNELAYFPNSLFMKSSISTMWGDRADKSTNITILSQFALYTSQTATTIEPMLQLYGMLMPYACFNITVAENKLDLLKNQPPYKNAILGMYQPWHGRVWIHTDDWGQ